MGSFNEVRDIALYELGVAMRSVSEEEVNALRQAILDARRIFLAGKGRSGLQVRGFAMRLMHLGLPVYVVDDITTPGIGEGDLLLIGSGSGRTPSLVRYAERAKALKARIALITISPSSPIAGLANCVVRIAAASPKLEDSTEGIASIQPMGSLFEQSLGLLTDLLTVQLMADLNADSNEMFARHANLE